MPDSRPEKRFHDLLSRLLDGDLEEADIRELVDIVKATPRFSAELRDQLLVDSRLAQFENELQSEKAFVRTLEAALEAEEDGDAFVDRVVRFADADTDEPPSSASKAPWLLAAASLAACLVFGFFWIRGASGISEDVTDPGVAVISHLIGNLAVNSSGKQVGDTVSPGIVQIDEGYLSLEFYRGAQVTVAGPARLELVDSERVICHYGKVRAQVPPVARGFTIVTPESEVVDLGTEFAIEVGRQGGTEIHVFDGEVEAYDKERSPESKTLLTAGLGVSITGSAPWESLPAEQDLFADLADLEQLELDAEEERFARWQANHQLALQDERLIAYYDFERENRKSRNLPNRALTGSELDGAMVGARWVRGPWQGKGALSFRRPGDRVRVHLPGEYDSITLAAWIRIDGIDRTHSSLLLTDGYEEGEVHWQLRQEGALILGYRQSEKRGKNYTSEEFVDLTNLGRWFHLATVIDHQTLTVSHFLDGEQIATHPIREQDLGPIRFGDASIGNWDQPLKNSGGTIRNLNGRIAELMVFREALPAEEIARLALQ